MRLTIVPWLRRSFLVREIFFNSRILRDLFFIGLSWLQLNVGRKIFPYMLMRGGQGRPCQPRQGFAYPLQLPSVSFLPRLHILVVSFSFEVEPSTLSYRYWAMNIQVRLRSSLGPSLWPNMDDFIRTTKLPSSYVMFLCQIIIDLHVYASSLLPSPPSHYQANDEIGCNVVWTSASFSPL